METSGLERTDMTEWPFNWSLKAMLSLRSTCSLPASRLSLMVQTKGSDSISSKYIFRDMSILCKCFLNRPVVRTYAWPLIALLD